MEYYNRTLCMTYDELTATGTDGEPVIKEATIRQNICRGNIERVKRGGGEGSSALIVWSSIPMKYRQRYVESFGDPREQLKEEMLISDGMRMDQKAREFYEGYTYYVNGEETTLSKKLIEEYTVNASVLGNLLKKINDRKALCHTLNKTMPVAWDIIQASSENLRGQYQHTLPRNLARLKDKIKDYQRDGYQSLISGKVGNRNTVKISEDAGRLLIALKRSRVPVYTDAQLFEKFNDEAEKLGWKPLKSVSGMKQWLNQAQIVPMWYDAVYGEQAARQKFGRKQKTVLPSRRDTLWYGDGTKLNLYYKGDDGKIRTTQVYEVVDASSEMLLGYHISDAEDYEAQYHAYRMAIQTSGHKPYEIVHDNQGGHKKLDKLGGFFGKICHIHRSTMPYNGESKTIESIFGRFQNQVLHQYWQFTGQNVTAKKKSSAPNIEFVAENKDNLPTLDELKNIYAKCRKQWNEMCYPGTDERRADRYARSVNEDTEEVGVNEMRDMFWIMNEKPVTYTDQGLTMTVKGKKYTWEVFRAPGEPDHEWLKTHTWAKFMVQYDPYDMTSVRLYAIDRAGGLHFERIAEPYMQIHRAIQDQSAEEKAQIRAELERNKQDRVDRQVAAKNIEYAHGTAPEQHGLKTPRLKGGNAEMQREIERRTKHYEKNPEEYELGRFTKQRSMEDVMEEDDEMKAMFVPIKVPEERTAGKL
jgi:hypothetical protein